jgi:alkylation response protein AidB-like acyl-CoA dehydrogenase
VGSTVAAARRRLRFGTAAVAAGIAGAAADAAASYATDRRQFGGPLTALATVRQSLLGQATRTAAALALAVAAADDDVQALAAAREACDAAVDVAAAALQSHGGYGYLYRVSGRAVPARRGLAARCRRHPRAPPSRPRAPSSRLEPDDEPRGKG